MSAGAAALSAPVPSAATGLLLAAGAGTRMGRPKALATDLNGVSFLDRSIRTLLDGGCSAVRVVLGAAGELAGELLGTLGWTDDPRVSEVHAGDWAEGMGASLRVGLRSLPRSSACAIVTLVDLQDVGPPVVRRLIDTVGADPASLGRAVYLGRPGHPVVLGRDHWDPVIESARGDQGARDYLGSHRPLLVECSDLATGRDADRPSDLSRGPATE